MSGGKESERESKEPLRAVIFDIQKNSAVDGPGMRTTVFFKGCNLRCRWCHNPESQSPRVQKMFFASSCSGCGLCAKVCPRHLESCDMCGRCAELCPSGARKICGREYSVGEVLAEAVADKAFYDASGGGVTFSGGECMLRADFLEEILRLCKEEGIRTAVDTAGAVPWESFERVIPYTDLFLYDVKCVTEELHIRGTGVSNRDILANLTKLSGRTKIGIRIPLIPGFNDSDAELRKTAGFLKTIRYESLEVLPYHGMGENKYAALNLNPEKFAAPSDERVRQVREMFASAA